MVFVSATQFIQVVYFTIINKQGSCDVWEFSIGSGHDRKNVINDI